MGRGYVAKALNKVKDHFAENLSIYGNIGRGSALATGMSDIMGYSTLDMPGNDLTFPAILFALGQGLIECYESMKDEKPFKEMPLLYRLPRYLKRAGKTLAPLIGLLIGKDEIYAEGITMLITYGLSDIVFGQLANYMEEKYPALLSDDRREDKSLGPLVTGSDKGYEYAGA
jgi:hypothetical protein